MKQDFNIEVRWIAFPLHPNTPEEGLTLEELFRDPSINVPAIMRRLKSVARKEGLPFGDRQMTYNSRLAQELGKWAETNGRGEDFHGAAFRAYFSEGRNIGKISELVKLAESIGLPGEEAQAVLERRGFRSAVDMDWEKSRRLGITAVPSMLMDGRLLVGAQPYETMAEFVGGEQGAWGGRLL